MIPNQSQLKIMHFIHPLRSTPLIRCIAMSATRQDISISLDAVKKRIQHAMERSQRPNPVRLSILDLKKSRFSHVWWV